MGIQGGGLCMEESNHSDVDSSVGIEKGILRIGAAKLSVWVGWEQSPLWGHKNAQ